MAPPTQPPRELQGLERAAMEQVWQQGEATVGSVAEAINAESGRRRAYTTFLTVMRRLDAKQLLVRERRGKTDYYSAAWSREAYLEARTKTDVDALLAAHGDRALVHFARQIDTLDPERRQALERMARDDD
jgi:predicted transcriptional regulator